LAVTSPKAIKTIANVGSLLYFSVSDCVMALSIIAFGQLDGCTQVNSGHAADWGGSGLVVFAGADAVRVLLLQLHDTDSRIKPTED